MILKKINKMNSLLKKEKNVNFKEVLLDHGLIITPSDVSIINSKLIHIEYLIMDMETNEKVKTNVIGKGENLKSAQTDAYAYMQNMLFAYKESSSITMSKDPIINRNQQKKLFAMASYDKIHSIIEPMGYKSIKDIKIKDFSKIIKILGKEKI